MDNDPLGTRSWILKLDIDFLLRKRASAKKHLIHNKEFRKSELADIAKKLKTAREELAALRGVSI